MCDYFTVRDVFSSLRLILVQFQRVCDVLHFGLLGTQNFQGGEGEGEGANQLQERQLAFPLMPPERNSGVGMSVRVKGVEVWFEGEGLTVIVLSFIQTHAINHLSMATLGPYLVTGRATLTSCTLWTLVKKEWRKWRTDCSIRRCSML